MAERKSGATEPKTFQYRVTSVAENTNGYVTVNFTQAVNIVTPGAVVTPTGFVNNVSLNLPAEEAAAYFPGQVYDVTFSVAANQ